MSDFLTIVAIFLSGALLVGAVMALDELTAALGLQPRSREWQIAPLCRADEEAPEEARKAGADCPPAGPERGPEKPLPRISLGYSPALSGLPAPSD